MQHLWKMTHAKFIGLTYLLNLTTIIKGIKWKEKQNFSRNRMDKRRTWQRCRHRGNGNRGNRVVVSIENCVRLSTMGDGFPVLRDPNHVRVVRAFLFGFTIIDFGPLNPNCIIRFFLLHFFHTKWPFRRKNAYRLLVPSDRLLYMIESFEQKTRSCHCNWINTFGSEI